MSRAEESKLQVERAGGRGDRTVPAGTCNGDMRRTILKGAGDGSERVPGRGIDVEVGHAAVFEI